MKDQILPNSSSTPARRPHAAGLLLRMTLAAVLALSGLLIAGPAWAEEQAGEQISQQEAVDTPVLPDVTLESTVASEEGDAVKDAAESQSAASAAPTPESLEVPQATEQSDTPVVPQSVEPLETYSGNCGAVGDGSNVTWSLDTEAGVLTISGTGAMAGYNIAPDDSNNPAPWQEHQEWIETVSIESNVESIGNYAFYNCAFLESITIPASVTSIGDYAFLTCNSLESIAIPDSVTSIGAGAFSNCNDLASVTISDYVTSIGFDTFYGCTSLASIDIPDGVISIGNNAFSGCTDLASVTLPDSVTSIGANAFGDCTSLTSITIPENVTSIGYGAFASCSALTSIDIPNSVTLIGDWVFNYCTSLVSITIPSNVTSIGDNVFGRCTSLTSIEVVPDNTHYSSDVGVLFNKEKSELIRFPLNGAQTNYTIPASVTSIGDSAFDACTSLTSVTIPNSITSIGERTFYDCPSLTSATIPNSVTSIGDFAFSYCTSLTSVTIPNNVTSIGFGAFSYCQGPIYCEAPSRPDGWNISWNAVYTGDIIWGWGSPPADTQAPTLSAASATRTSATAATITFTSDEAGSYYRAVVAAGTSAPAIDTTGAGTAMSAGSQSFTITGLASAGAYDVYLVGKDATGNAGASLKVTVPAHVAPDTKAPTLSKASATRASATTAKVSFTSSEAGSYYRAVVTKGAKTPAVNTTGAGSALKAGSQSLTVGGLVSTKAYDIYLIGKDAAGNISTKLKVSVSAWKAGFTGWKKTGSQWYYYKAGTKQKNTALSIQGKIYSFSATGAMITGWAKIKGVKRYHDSEGIAVKGWKKIGKYWYYFKTKGAAMATGAQKIGAAWYVFAGGNSGRMLTGWQKVGTSRYYLRGGSDGRAYTGWVKSGKSWYYFNPKTAKMASGWQKISGRYYYLSGANDGHMVTGTKTIKGVKYRFNASGALVSPKAPKK